jgi:predicted RNase H-like nuclease (RuvC/YqgF family)
VGVENRRLDRDDPVILDLVQRVTRLEAQVSDLRQSLNRLEESLDKLDSRLWYVITGIALSILVQILFYLLR